MTADNPFLIDALIEKTARAALEHTNGNRTEAAKLLGISVRTLRNWINRYKIAKAPAQAGTE